MILQKFDKKLVMKLNSVSDFKLAVLCLIIDVLMQ